MLPADENSFRNVGTVVQKQNLNSPVYVIMRHMELRMKKSTKIICMISGVLLGLAAVYLAGNEILLFAGLEYRFWVSVLGQCLCFLVLPLWIIGVAIWALWQRFREKALGKWLVRLFGGMAAVCSLVWCYIGFLLIVFTVNEDRYLGGGLVTVVVQDFLEPARYEIYESAGPFFRKKTSLTPEKVADYLTVKYKREFYSVEENGKTLYVDAERESIRIAVKYIGGKLQENYPQALADNYLAEGYQALGLAWDVCVLKTDENEEHFCLVLDEEKNSEAFGADIYRLMQYALKQDALLKKYHVYTYLLSAKYEGIWGREGFGRNRRWEDSDLWDYFRDFEDDEARVVKLVMWDLDSIRLQAQREWSKAQEAAQGSQSSQGFVSGSTDTVPIATPEPTPELTEREVAEAEYPEQSRAAEAIWETELKDSGYDYAPRLNAKGNLVIWLGKLPSDRLQSATEESDYYLTYDRESKNGNCYLFVLSEVPEGYGINDAYLREFYACEKDTLKVAAGNKTSWAQVGCAEYRELTGE